MAEWNMRLLISNKNACYRWHGNVTSCNSIFQKNCLNKLFKRGVVVMHNTQFNFLWHDMSEIERWGENPTGTETKKSKMQ